MDRPTTQNLVSLGRHFVRPIPFKAHRIDGFSPETLERSYEEKYGGTVRRLNEVQRLLGGLPTNRLATDEFQCLKKEERFLSGEISLYEAFFDGLGEDGGEALSDTPFQSALKTDFGSVQNWWDEVRSLVKSWTGGPGWIVLFWSSSLEQLLTVPIAHDQSIPASVPIFALNMDKNIWAEDFGGDSMAYAKAVFHNLHWSRIAQRFHACKTTYLHQPDPNQISVRELAERIAENDETVFVLDVRHDDDRERYTARIMETDWRDSFCVPDWADECDRTKTIVVYCMYGFWVSQKVAEELRARGLKACSLEGGIAAWRAMGLPTTDTKTAPKNR
ncbi:MAG: hypothetical protein KTR23_10285 [Rhodospirillales bacterium]|nr:hypothetical protein [Rhodospirillales bacterium]